MIDHAFGVTYDLFTGSWGTRSGKRSRRNKWENHIFLTLVILFFTFTRTPAFCSGSGQWEPHEGDAGQISLKDVPRRLAGVQQLAARFQGQEEEAGKIRIVGVPKKTYINPEGNESLVYLNPDLMSKWEGNFNPIVTRQMARKMKVAGTELSEEEIENMLEQGRYFLNLVTGVHNTCRSPSHFTGHWKHSSPKAYWKKPTLPRSRYG